MTHSLNFSLDTDLNTFGMIKSLNLLVNCPILSTKGCLLGDYHLIKVGQSLAQEQQHFWALNTKTANLLAQKRS